jgi:antagonist of mitotic exit network protein 1
MDVEMQSEPSMPIQVRKLRRIASPRKTLSSLLSSSAGSPPSPASAGLETLLKEGESQKYPRRTVTPSPFRFALTTCKEIFNLQSTPPPSPTRIHKAPTPAQIPCDLSIPQTPTADKAEYPFPPEDDEPRLTPFDIPTILEQIISYLDDSNSIPSEPAPVRRKPLSYQHALLIYYPNVQRAQEAWAAACRSPAEDSTNDSGHSGVYACLLVNKEWHEAARRVLRRRAFFTAYEPWIRFANRKEGHTPHLRTLVLHKVRQARDEELQRLGQQPRLEWLELHVCPELLPSEDLLCSPHLKRIALPGCSRVDDSTLEIIAKNCPNLEILDLRACELVTDKGLTAIADGCPKLKYLNVGRVKGGERITCSGVDAIARYFTSSNPANDRLTDVDTLGLAGCAVSDRGIWSVATHRGAKIERLSLNNCLNLSNASIPLILQHTPNLQVLELRGCVKITQVRPIVEFRKKWRARGVLIEGCEIFEGRMRHCEDEMDREERQRTLEREQDRQSENGEPMEIDNVYE